EHRDRREPEEAFQSAAAASDDGPRTDGDRLALLEKAQTEAEQLRTEPELLKRPGPPLNRRSPFLVGLLGAAGVLTTYGIVQMLLAASSVLVLIGLSMFLAIGLEPAVRWL